jgi:hypothetical protein
MKEIVVAIDPNNIHQIAITCRCGKRFVVEIPGEVLRAKATSLHQCPSCGQPYAHDSATMRLVRLHREGMFPEKVMEPGHTVEPEPEALRGKYIHKGNDTIQ